jgi:hypothetical protein
MRDEKQKNTMKPMEFMHNKQPALYSDSQMVIELHLSPEMLEYHLNSLTSRNQ